MPSASSVARVSLALLCSSLLVTPAVHAQSGAPAAMPPLRHSDPRVASVLDAMHKAHTPQALALSPDGALLAWTLRVEQGEELHLLDVAHPDAAGERLLSPPSGTTGCSARAPLWSPDGSTLAFLSSCAAPKDDSAQDQFFLYSRKTGRVRQLTHLRGEVQDPAWSPDGHRLAFLFVENATRKAGALDAMTPWSGVIGEDGVEVQRVAVADASSGTVTQATPPSLHIYEFDWSPSSRDLTYTGAPPPGENNWWVAQLYTQHLVANAEAHVVFDPAKTDSDLHGLQIANPRFSPDGKRIAFIGGLMSDQGATGGDIYTLPAAGGSPRDVLPDKNTSAAWLEWTGKDRIHYLARKDGGNLISVFDAESGKTMPESTESFSQSISAGQNALTSSTRGSYAFIASSFDAPPEIYLSRGPSHPLAQLTHLNAGLKPVWGKSESVDWTSDSFHVQGWLLYPANYDPSRRYPLIVEVHGGPSSSAGSHWGSGDALYSALGYFVLMPNPRGSYGQGEKFTQANIKDFGYGDLHDILAGVDMLEKRVSIDPTREGLTGWSYGGFMTMFGVTQTTRFRAAVAGAGISDWKSYYGENSIDQWMLPFFGKTVYDDPAIYAKSSAIDFIHNVKTPTLVIVGDRDGECPAPQSFEFWHALRAAGVKTELVVYPNEGHGFRDATHIRDRAERVVNWFDQNMPAGQPATSTH